MFSCAPVCLQIFRSLRMRRISNASQAHSLISPASLRLLTTGLMICPTTSTGMCSESPCNVLCMNLNECQIIETFLVFAGQKGVNCLYRRPTEELCFTSAHFLRWTFTCMWKYTSRWWSAAPATPCTNGPSVSKITVRKVLLKYSTKRQKRPIRHEHVREWCLCYNFCIFCLADISIINNSTWSGLSEVERKKCVLWVFICPLICPFCL